MMKLLDVPSIFRYFADSVGAVTEKTPKGFQIVGVTRKATTDANNGNGFD